MTSANPERRLTVTLDQVSVQVNDVGEDFAPTCLSVLADLSPFGRHKPAKRTILHNVSCQVRPGEMVIILEETVVLR
jgi:ATP-binding cassette subfamily G (WHITE) protein 2 (SNQ2)